MFLTLWLCLHDRLVSGRHPSSSLLPSGEFFFFRNVIRVCSAVAAIKAFAFSHLHTRCRSGTQILKAEKHRVALLKAATSGSPKFFLGTDSAPHETGSKESACGCAGVFSAHAAVELYAEAFDQAGALDKLEDFCASYGADHYGLERNTTTITLEKKPWTVPAFFDFGDGGTVTPLRATEEVQWSIVE